MESYQGEMNDMRKINISKELLIKKYHLEKLTLQQIADEMGVHADTVFDRMSDHGIPRRKSGLQNGQKLSDFHRKQISKAKKGSKNPAWKGGRIINAGYFYLHRPDHPFSDNGGYTLEHRLIAEKSLGRFLKPGEVVHHINQVTTDNRKENLLICTRGYHNSLHWRMRRRRLPDLIQEMPG